MSDIVKRLESHMGLADIEKVLADCREAATEIKRLRALTSPPLHQHGGGVENLDERMKAAGMFTVAEMMGVTPLTKWKVQVGMTDLDFFSEWLDRKVREYLSMKASYDLGDKDEKDELYEWILAHAGAYSSIRENFRAARAALAQQPLSVPDPAVVFAEWFNTGPDIARAAGAMVEIYVVTSSGNSMSLSGGAALLDAKERKE